MPLYDYQCTACGQVTEVRHGFKETHQGACPACGATGLKRVFNPAPILFKGSGFYVTDSRKPSDSGSAPAAAPAAAPAPAGESKKSGTSAA